jgi:hypothetical protein
MGAPDPIAKGRGDHSDRPRSPGRRARLERHLGPFPLQLTDRKAAIAAPADTAGARCGAGLVRAGDRVIGASV